MTGKRMIAWVMALGIGCSDGVCGQQQAAHHETVVLTAEMAQDQPLRFFVGVITPDGQPTSEERDFIESFAHCCQWSGCFAVDVHYLPQAPHKKSDIQNLFKNSYDCAVFLSGELDKGMVEWRLYDTALGTMLKGKKQLLVDSDDVQTTFLAYKIAGSVLQELMGEQQPFFSKIAYRKKDRKNKKYELITAHFDGSHARSILTSSRILVSLQWNKDPEYPILFFSEFTTDSVCLKMSDLQGRTMVILDTDGTTAGVSCSPCSDDVVYCHSGDIWKYHYDKKNKKSVHTRIIHEKGISSSPILLDNGDVIYSHKGLIKRYHALTGDLSVLVDCGYCVSPAYSPAIDKLAYAKRVNGFMQLFTYDFKTGHHEQVTYESKKSGNNDYRSDKTEVCWSPDGRYLLFTWERKNVSRIGLLNVVNKQYSFITPENEYCSYPTWS